MKHPPLNIVCAVVLSLSLGPGCRYVLDHAMHTAADPAVERQRMERPALFVGDAEEGAATLQEAEVSAIFLCYTCHHLCVRAGRQGSGVGVGVVFCSDLLCTSCM